MSDAEQILSRAERFRRKGVECRQIADSAKLPQSKVIFANLAQSYRRLAMHEERLEEVIGRSVGAPAKRQSRSNRLPPQGREAPAPQRRGRPNAGQGTPSPGGELWRRRQAIPRRYRRRRSKIRAGGDVTGKCPTGRGRQAGQDHLHASNQNFSQSDPVAPVSELVSDRGWFRAIF